MQIVQNQNSSRTSKSKHYAQDLYSKDQVSKSDIPNFENRTMIATVMFCDLVNSTHLSVSLEPTILRQFLLSYYNLCDRQIAQHHGMTMRYVGDGVMSVFHSDEDPEANANNAIRSALSITELATKLSFTNEHLVDEKISVRISMSTGTVLAGGLIGKGPAQQESVFGATPFLAAKLKQCTLPGNISISSSTYKLVKNSFNTKYNGQHHIGGFDKPILSWRVRP